MIESVKLAGEGVYVINNAVKLYNITVEENGVFYDVDFDESSLDEAAAVALCEEFMEKAITKFLADHEAQADSETSSSDEAQAEASSDADD